ncbi:MAG: hypothetical protein DSY84_08505, partial [Candidatus Neomarinimicrobiota bacterium]
MVSKTLQTRALCVLAVLFLAPGGVHPRAGATQIDLWFAPDLAAYRVLVDAYRESRTREAIDGVLALETEAIHEMVDAVRALED